ncbi:hypothetical protein niasHT_009335 [Heterodera trifolii]|uniref:Uncharacterized protein n=1 Tax=Heterodera trifolii TaxID=157864 RepID=A0ABD2LZ23_9BILA
MLSFLLFLPFFGICFAAENDDNKYMATLYVLPGVASLGEYEYFSEAFCRKTVESTTEEGSKTEVSTKTHITHESFTHRNESDFVTLGLGNDDCEKGFEIGIALIKKDTTWSPWLKPIMLEPPIVFIDGNVDVTKKVEFGSYFKLDISPKLDDNSGIVYRVNVYCADNNHLEFKTYTKSLANVVINSNYKLFTPIGSEKMKPDIKGQLCKKYKINVWPIYEKWVDYPREMSNEKAKWENLVSKKWGNLLRQTEFSVDNGVAIKKDATYKQVKFPSYFNLTIHPSLDHEADPIYFVKVKCSREDSSTFKTFTHGNTQIVLNEKTCTKFDISVSKLDKEIEFLEELSTIRPKMKKIGEKIKKGDDHTIKYSEEQKSQLESEKDDDNLVKEDDSMGDDDDNVDDNDGNMDDNDDDDLGIDIDEIIRELEMEKGKDGEDEGLGLDDDEDDLEGSDDDPEEDEPKPKKARAPPKTKVNKTTSKIAAKKGKKILESEDDDEDDLDGSDDGPVEKEDKPKPKKARAPPKPKPNKKVAAKKGKKKVSESEDDFEADWDSGDDDWEANASSSTTKKRGSIAMKMKSLSNVKNQEN